MRKILSILLLLLVAKSASCALVGHTGKYFTVTENDRSYRVGRESLDGTLRNINASNLLRFMQKGRISTHKLSDGSYMLRGHVNGLGGGPMLASFAYWCTKSLCWGSVAAAGAGVIATGVGAGTALLGGGTVAGTLTGGAGAAAGLALETTVAVGTGGGTAVVAGALANTAVGASIAAETTVGLVTTSAGTSLGLIGFIEGLALAAYAGALTLPTP